MDRSKLGQTNHDSSNSSSIGDISLPNDLTLLALYIINVHSTTPISLQG